MVKNVVNLIYREVRGLHQAAYVLGVFAFGSQLLALVRDRMLAHTFGAGGELDLYYAAFRIPDLLYVLFASTLSVYVLIPFVAKRMHNGDGSEARELLGQMFSLFLIFYAFFAASFFFAAPYLIPKMFPGLLDNQDTLVLLVRILLLQPLFLGLSSLFGVVTQLDHRFVLYAVSPLIYNIGIVVGIAFFYPYLGLVGLVVGVVLGAIGHLLVQVPLVQSGALRFKFTNRFDWLAIKSVLAVSIPRALTLSMHQVTLLVVISIASVMTVGSVAIFQLAYNLQSVPLAVIGASYSTAAFPLLADLFAENKMEKFRLHIITAFKHIIFWSVPAIGLIVVLRAQIVRVVLGSGQFNWGDTKLTAAVLALLVLSLLAQALNLLLVRAFYAGGITKIPFFVTLFGTIATIISVLSLYHYHQSHPDMLAQFEILMRVREVAGTEVIILALGYSIGIILQTIVLVILAVKIFALDVSWFVNHFSKSLIAAICGGLLAYMTLNLFVAGLNTERFLGILLQGTFAGFAGLFGVITAYYLTKSPELTEVYRSLHSRIFKARVVSSQDDVL